MESWLIRITNYLLTQSWQIAVLTIAVVLGSFLLRNRSAHVRYLLWLIVLAKCLVPPLYPVPIAILPQKESASNVPAPLIVEPMVSEIKVPEVVITKSPGSASIDSEAASLPQVTTSPAGYEMRAWLAIGWIVGVVALSFYYLLNALRTQIWLQKKRKALPREFASDVERFFLSNRVRHIPRVWLLDRINQPFVWGLVRGSIYLPARLFDGKHVKFQSSLLGHELSHIIRLDAMINSLQVIAQTVFWFHPFVWWANRKIRTEREKCCDEMTIARLNALPDDYSEAIVETLAAKYEQARPIPSLAVAGQVKNIEERINTMLKPGKKFHERPNLVAAIVVLLVALLTVPTALVLTARAQTRPDVKSLHKAAIAGDVERVKSLISKGADVNEKDSGGKTPLHFACEKGHTEVAKLLISHGAGVNDVSSDRRYSPDWRKPLHYAAMGGYREMVKLLISKGADINSGYRQPWFEAMKSSAPGGKEVVELLVAKGAEIPALHLAAYTGDMKKLEKLLEEGVDVNALATNDFTALHAAANGGNKDVMVFLISKGVKVDAKDSLGLTPLYYAALHNHEQVMDLLLDKGADIDANEKGYTLLYYGIFCDGDRAKDAIKLLISKGANVNAKDIGGYTPLNYAIWMNYSEIVEVLINNGANVNTKDIQGFTPYYWAALDGRKDLVELLVTKGATPISTIHFAARAGDLEKVKTFIQEGADINAKDGSDRTPLFSAVLADNSDVAKLLISKGANVNAEDKDGVTPLHFVMGVDKKDMLELLIDKGANVNAKSNRGETPLFGAAYGNLSENAELLIANGANVDAKCRRRSISGITPLYVACSRGYKDVAELLIVKGADINIKDSNGQMPLHLACVRGHKDVVELLIAKGADMNAKDNKEKTPLSLAREQGHGEIVRFLLKHGAGE